MPGDSAAFSLSETLAFVAAIAATGAFFVSWLEARRNNKAIVKLMRFQAASHMDCGTGKGYSLEVWIRNGGLPLQHVSLALCFCGPGKSGNFTIPVPLQHESEIGGSFLRGTLARFRLITKNPRDVHLLPVLKDPKEQEAALCLYSAGFLVDRFPVCRRMDRLRNLWNRLSWRLMFQHRVGEGAEGKGVFKMYHLPTFIERSSQLRFFLSGVSEMAEE